MSHSELINEIQRHFDRMPDEVLEKILFLIKENQIEEYSDLKIIAKLETVFTENDILLKRLSE